MLRKYVEATIKMCKDYAFFTAAKYENKEFPLEKEYIDSRVEAKYKVSYKLSYRN